MTSKSPLQLAKGRQGATGLESLSESTGLGNIIPKHNSAHYALERERQLLLLSKENILYCHLSLHTSKIEIVQTRDKEAVVRSSLLCQS